MRFRKTGLLPALWAFACLASGATPSIDPASYLEDVKFLAGNDLRGRGTGTPGLEKAARFVAGKFGEFGLRPPGEKNYSEPFPITTAARLGQANRLTVIVNGKARTLRCQDEFIPFSFSSSGRAAGEVVFAGYGITAPEYRYDDYAGLNVRGKFVLILRHEPQEFDERSVFAGRQHTQHAQFASKASNARMHGAAGVILINDRVNHEREADELQKFGTTTGPADAGLPYLQVKADEVAGWFRESGKDLEAIGAAIDKELKPQSFAFPAGIRVEAALDLERAVKTVHNVVGYLPGETDEYVIVGAHYDHLGLGEQFSMAPSMAGTVHPGADDNASGTAGVIELARWFSRQPKQKRGILFLAFAGEELGLLGSSYYAAHPLLPLEKAVAMINLDMIGRVRNGKVFIGGAATGSTFRQLLDRVATGHDLNLDYSEAGGYGSSDHASFIARQVPALFFFSGLHNDYHKPGDTWDKIQAGPAARLLELVADVVAGLRAAEGRPQFVRVAAPAHGEDTPPSGSGYGAFFGSIPDFGEGVKGVRFADVSQGSPAEKAGLHAGDVLVEFAGKPIQNLYDFTYALRGNKPGDEVQVRVLRDGKPLEATVRLAARP